jgi:hypothetical protein
MTVKSNIFLGPFVKKLVSSGPLGLVFFTLIVGSCTGSPSAVIAPAEDEWIADMDPVSAGLIDAEFSRPLSSAVSKREVDVYFCPRDNTVYLEFRHQGMTFRQYWNSSNRSAFREALEKYKVDYQDRSLIDRANRTRRIYGTLQGMIQWGFSPQIKGFGLALGSQGYPHYDLGYAFKRDSSTGGETPYFTVFQEQSTNVLAVSDPGQSLYLFIHFTRAQADNLVLLFDQDYLLSLVRSPVPSAAGSDTY